MQKQSLLVFFLILFAFPLVSAAQTAGTLTLQAEPSFPEAGETFTVNSMVQGGVQTSQSWFVNGGQKSESENKSSITLEATDAPMRITSRVIFANGTQVEASKTITPVRIDLVLSAATLSPAFYKGLSLPSSGSPFSVTALVFKNGSPFQNGLSYAWSINNKGGGNPIRGNNSVAFTPNFESEVFVTVHVFDSSNTKIGEETISVPVAKPEVYFYEHNPLRGLSKVALSDPYIFAGDEMTVRGEGYYLSADSSAEDMFTEWKINGKKVESSSPDGQEVSLRKEGNRGSASLSFHIRNLKDLLQGVKEDITITF